jgi:hypothetical protein
VIRRLAIALAASTLVCTPFASQAQALGSVERYIWRQTEDGGAALIQNPAGGEWAYTTSDLPDGRKQARFALGKLARTEYTLFSAEEEAALWSLRQAQRTPSPKARTRRVAHHDPIRWPRVVLKDGKTCVPWVSFSEGEDWLQHLTCWSREDRRVD